ncbi:MAG TPA: hypothetical protein VFA46_07360, partial [Actinomycetes bacterium]|nr:hypothetical protein [Actinomycetes bacterium]
GVAAPGSGGPGHTAVGTRVPEAVDAALARDLDTVAALAAVDELAARDGAAVPAAAAVLGVIL